mmetsp:Transcript_4821/g.10437  ORF Transcript_4821/g.10437 Transcript_4821/m.10437 type:complete len:258 (+) Transcript_4821:16-789(+)
MTWAGQMWDFMGQNSPPLPLMLWRRAGRSWTVFTCSRYAPPPAAPSCPGGTPSVPECSTAPPSCPAPAPFCPWTLPRSPRSSARPGTPPQWSVSGTWGTGPGPTLRPGGGLTLLLGICRPSVTTTTRRWEPRCCLGFWGWIFGGTGLRRGRSTGGIPWIFTWRRPSEPLTTAIPPSPSSCTSLTSRSTTPWICRPSRNTRTLAPTSTGARRRGRTDLPSVLWQVDWMTPWVSLCPTWRRRTCGTTPCCGWPRTTGGW